MLIGSQSQCASKTSALPMDYQAKAAEGSRTPRRQALTCGKQMSRKRLGVRQSSAALNCSATDKSSPVTSITLSFSGFRFSSHRLQ
jgi:hypothetical protein